MRRVAFTKGEYYHIYNRGVEKRPIFTTKEEYQRFAAYLNLLNTKESLRPRDALNKKNKDTKQKKPLVAIGAYCLMPDHFHIVLTPLTEDGVSKFMQRLQTAYTMYFNERHQRSGSLFAGTFKASNPLTDIEMMYFYSYIHLNPAKLIAPSWKRRDRGEMRRLEKSIMQYPHSSIGEYVSQDWKVVNPALFPKYFGEANDFESIIALWFQSDRGTNR